MTDKVEEDAQPCDNVIDSRLDLASARDVHGHQTKTRDDEINQRTNRQTETDCRANRERHTHRVSKVERTTGRPANDTHLSAVQLPNALTECSVKTGTDCFAISLAHNSKTVLLLFNVGFNRCTEVHYGHREAETPGERADKKDENRSTCCRCTELIQINTSR